MNIPLSLYVHFPWCIKKCPYCDFNSYRLSNKLPETQYIDCLVNDLQHDLKYIHGRKIQSIFLGGGTPSLFAPKNIESILNNIQKKVSLCNDVEITLEVNPGSLEHYSLSDYAMAGVNRFSIGAQSFDNAMLQKIGRIHCREDTINVIQQLQSINIKSFNIDIMHSLPGQNLNLAIADLTMAISLAAPHISWYQLTIEPNTFFAKYPPVVPNDDYSWEIQTAGYELLNQAGFHQYEVSGFCKPKHQCSHNLNYWKFGDYIGIGAGAHGKLTDPVNSKITRTWKTRNPEDYLKRHGDYLAGSKTIDIQDIPGEFMLNQLRLSEGFYLEHYRDRTNLPESSITDILKEAKAKGLIDFNDKYVQATTLGKRFLNDLVQMFFSKEVHID